MHKCEKQQYKDTITDFDFYTIKIMNMQVIRSLRTVTHAYFTNGISFVYFFVIYFVSQQKTEKRNKEDCLFL